MLIIASVETGSPLSRTNSWRSIDDVDWRIFMFGIPGTNGLIPGCPSSDQPLSSAYNGYFNPLVPRAEKQ